MGINSSRSVLIAAGVAAGIAVLVALSDTQPLDSNEVGVHNRGNTCFLSALLQGLSAVDTFNDFLELAVSKDRDGEEANDIVKELQKCISNLRTGDAHVYPDDLISHLSRKFPYFGQQQDSHEISLVVHDALSETKKLPPLELFVKTERHPLIDPFVGVQANKVVCPHCGHQTKTLESFSCLFMEVRSSLNEGLYEFVKGSNLDDYECLKCSYDLTRKELHRQSKESASSPSRFDRTARMAEHDRLTESLDDAFYSGDISKAEFVVKSKNTARIMHTISKLPDVLCIVAKRLIYDSSGHLLKIQSHMNFSKVLAFTDDLKQALLEDPEQEDTYYRLVSVIEHYGTALGGHYVAYKLRDDAWYYDSDTVVKKVTERAVLTSQAYMLFYEKVKDE